MLSVLGASSLPDFSSVGKKGGKKYPLHLLASKLLSVLPLPGHGPRESPLPSSALPAHLELFLSHFTTAEFKKRILNESRHQLIHKTQGGASHSWNQFPSASQGSSSRPPHTHVSFQLLLLMFRGSCILRLLWGERRRGLVDPCSPGGWWKGRVSLTFPL